LILPSLEAEDDNKCQDAKENKGASDRADDDAYF
jgi:hypothetical protein